MTQTYYQIDLGVRSLTWSCWVKSSVLAGLHSFLEDPGKSPFPCIASFRGCLRSLARGPFHLQIHQWLAESFTHHATLTLALSPPSSTFKDTCNDTGPIQTIQNHLLLSKPVSLVTSPSPLWCVTSHRFPGPGRGPLGPLPSLPVSAPLASVRALASSWFLSQSQGGH